MGQIVFWYLIAPAAGFLAVICVAFGPPVRSHLLRSRFNKIFGFYPPLKSDRDEGIRLLQGNVDDRIRELALRLEAEEKSLFQVEPQDRLQRMRVAREDRKEFYRILRLAKRFGFKVEETTYEYTRAPKAVD